ncbi:MAG: helix-turn-helix transcriptional regulator [Thermoanaerobaculia bacterium]
MSIPGVDRPGTRMGIPALPFCHVQLTAKIPDHRYPKALSSLGDHLRKRRLDLGLYQMDVAARVGADTKTVTNWELNRTEPDLAHLPALLAFLGFDPRPEGQTFGERLYRARTAKGLSHRDLARLIEVDESTVWKWEDGRHRPMGRLLDRLCEVLPETEDRAGQLG